MNWRKAASILVSVATFAALQACLNHLIPGGAAMGYADAAATAVAVFFAVVAGGWFSRSSFIWPALLLWLVLMSVPMSVTYQITLAARPVGMGRYVVDFGIANAPMLMSTLIAAAAGALTSYCGTRRRRIRAAMIA